MAAASKYERPEIRPVSGEDADLVSDILADAFDDDPMMNWNFGSRRPFKTCFLELAKGLYLRKGYGHVAGEEAAALWLPANEKRTAPILNEARIGLAAIASGGFAAMMRAKKVGDVMTASHPHTPHYYLFAVGVRRRSQGKGLGGGIIRAGLDRVDAARAPAYLESSNPRNEPLYERFGFRRQFRLALPPGAPGLLAMWREAPGTPP